MEAWVTVLCAIITAAAGIVVARINKRDKEDRAARDATVKRRERESRLSMDMMSATMELAYVTSLAVTGGHINGNVEAAQQRADSARKEYEDFLKDEAAHSVAGI